uniref:Uncharacterized protein n=1 Tax=Anopheles darlingi TaxID=43151 RepID=A0A2M4DLI1_ANODA
MLSQKRFRKKFTLIGGTLLGFWGEVALCIVPTRWRRRLLDVANCFTETSVGVCVCVLVCVDGIVHFG